MTIEEIHDKLFNIFKQVESIRNSYIYHSNGVKKLMINEYAVRDIQTIQNMIADLGLEIEEKYKEGAK